MQYAVFRIIPLINGMKMHRRINGEIIFTYSGSEDSTCIINLMTCDRLFIILSILHSFLFIDLGGFEVL